MRSHPTRYAGVQFRSRLEARWAAFFDLAGWKWEYEPSDEDGWVPDFFLLPKNDEPIAVEVKPIEWPNNEDACLKIYEERDDLEKVRKHTKHERLVLGKYIPDIYQNSVMYAGTDGTVYQCNCMFGITISEGWTKGIVGDDTLHPWAEPAILYEGYDSLLDYAAAYGVYHYRIGGEYDGDCHLKSAVRQLVEKVWREAGNRVQWHAPAPTRDVKPRLTLFD